MTKWLENKIKQVLANTDHQPNPSLTTHSRTPNTMPTPNSEDPTTMIFTETMKMMKEMFETSQAETRRLVLDLVQGRAQQTSPQETQQTEPEPLTSFDYDSTPLPPGVQAILERENDETLEHQVLLKERVALQQRILEAEEQMMQSRSQSEGLSSEPWQETSQG